MWRGSSTYFSMNTRSSPNEERASRAGALEPFAQLAARRGAMRMPLPPPPAAALTITG